jgi:hypothetical protein
MSNKELLPCTFCSGEAKYGTNDGFHYIWCDDCGETIFGLSKKEAFDIWNTRVQCIDNEENCYYKNEENVVANGNYLEKQDSSNSSEIPNSSKVMPLVPKWTKYSDKTLILNVNFMQCAYVEFHITNVKNKYRLTAFLKSNDSYCNEEDGGIFTTIKEAKEKANDYIKWIGKRLVCFAENIRIEE